MVQLIIPWEFLALSIQDSEEGFPFETILEALSKFKLRSASTNHPNSKFLTTTQVTPSRIFINESGRRHQIKSPYKYYIKVSIRMVFSIGDISDVFIYVGCLTLEMKFKSMHQRLR